MKFEYNKEFIEENLKEVLEAVPLFSYREASMWYSRANNIAKELSKKYRVAHYKVCGIIAALSPQKSWPQNISITELFLKTKCKECKHVTRMHDKAIRVFNAKSNKEVDKILNGKKIVNFYNHIYKPQDDKYVVLDVHMLQLILQNYRVKSCTDKQYEFLKDIFIKFAKKEGFKVSTLQSILWLYFRVNKKRIK